MKLTRIHPLWFGYGNLNITEQLRRDCGAIEFDAELLRSYNVCIVNKLNPPPYQ